MVGERKGIIDIHREIGRTYWGEWRTLAISLTHSQLHQKQQTSSCQRAASEFYKLFKEREKKIERAGERNRKT